MNKVILFARSTTITPYIVVHLKPRYCICSYIVIFVRPTQQKMMYEIHTKISTKLDVTIESHYKVQYLYLFSVHNRPPEV